MKKIFNILLLSTLLLGTYSCTEPLSPGLSDGKQVIPEGATITVGFGVWEDVATKGPMADNPSIERIHVLVFDEYGILVQAKEATLGTKTVNRNYDSSKENTSTEIYYSWWNVELLMSAEKRTLHFVANLNDNQVPTSGSQQSIFQTLATTAPQSSYWQRIELDEIQPYTYQGGTQYEHYDGEGVLRKTDVPGTVTGGSYNDGKYDVFTGDYIDRDGKKIVDGTGYYFVPPTDSPLRDKIYLVRNFARIQFTNTWSAFTLKKIALVNYPKTGLVAPYVNSNGTFLEAYMKAGTQDLVYLNGEEYVSRVDGYAPMLPSEGIETENYTLQDVTDNSATLYMYERGIPTSDATCVLVGGNFDGGTNVTTWFKIEIAKEDGSYFPIYRDFTYNMILGSLDNNATRHATAADALAHAPVGDISGSTETATLSQITDGNGLVLWVHEIDHAELNGGHPVALLFTFVYENKSTHAVLKDFYNNVSFEAIESQGWNGGWATESTGAVTTASETITSGSEYYSLIPNTAYPWHYVLVNLESYVDANLRSMIRVKGSVDVSDYSDIEFPTGQSPKKKTLYRDVTYTVMGKQNLKLKTTGPQTDAVGQLTTLTIELPTTLADGVFPLTFRIEAKDNNIAPYITSSTPEKDKMPTEVGTSAFSGGGNTYYFLKTIDKDMYKNSTDKKFDCVFQLTKATGKTNGQTITQISVREQPKSKWFPADAVVDLKVNTESTYTSITN